MRIPALLCLALSMGQGASALTLPEAARLAHEALHQRDKVRLPTEVFDGQSIPTVSLEGAVRRQAWHMPANGATSVQIMAPLRAELQDAGYSVLLECSAAQCGGYDFRFGIEVIPAPAMYVDLRDFEYLTAIRGRDSKPDAAVGLLVSVTQDTGFVQVTEVDRAAIFTPVAQATVVESPPTPEPAQSEDFFGSGSIVLEALDFPSGTTDLSPGPYDVLARLAAWLSDHPQARVMLVGHTDNVGALPGNIAISKARAFSVRTRLIERYGVSPDQLSADGVGFMAPRADNETEAGREKNRRVEAVLLSAP